MRVLLVEEGGPVDDERQGGVGVFSLSQGDEKTLAVGCDVEKGANRRSVAHDE